MQHEPLPWQIHTRLDKWASEAERLAGLPPAETVETTGNLLLDAGAARLLDLLIGAGGQAFDATHCRLGAGDGTTAAANGDTDLSAAAGSTHRWFQVMDATYPSRSGRVVTFRATFGTSDGNFHWQEWAIDAGGSSGNTVTAPLLNRKVVDQGVKGAGTSWQFTVTLTI